MSHIGFWILEGVAVGMAAFGLLLMARSSRR